MDSSVRKSLQTLSSLLAEGFIDQAEYEQRRDKVISGATGTKPLSTAASASRTVISSLSAPTPKSSGFGAASSEEATGTTGGAKQKPGKKEKVEMWAHDGFQELYGGGGARQQKPQQQQQKIVQPWEAIGKPSGGDLREKLKKPGGDLRSAISKQKPKGDLRAKLLHSNKQIQKQADLRARIGQPKLERNLPKQCPW